MVPLSLELAVERVLSWVLLVGMEETNQEMFRRVDAAVLTLGAMVFAVFLLGGRVTLYSDVFRGLGVLVWAAVFCVFVLWARRFCWRGPSGFGFVATAVGGLFGWIAFRSLAVNWHADAAWTVAKFAGLAVMFVVLAGWMDGRNRRVVLRLVALGLLGLSGLTALGWVLDWQGFAFDFKPPWSAGFGNRNMFGSTVALALGLAGALPLVERDRRWRFVGVLAVFGGCVLVVGAGSRNALLVTMAMGAAYLLGIGGVVQRWSWKRLALSASVYVAVCLLVLSFATPEALRERLSGLAKGDLSASDSGRLYLYQVALASIRSGVVETVLGQGAGSFGLKLHATDPSAFGEVFRKSAASFAHSEYLEWWHDGGIVALIWLLLIHVVALAAVVRLVLRSQVKVERRIMALGVLVTLAGWLVIGLTSVSTRYVGAQFFWLLALAFSWRMVAGPGRHGFGGLFKIAVTALICVALYLALTVFRADRLTLLAVEAETADELEVASHFVEGAIAWRSDHPMALQTGIKVAWQLGDVGTARRYHKRLESIAPRYLSSDVFFASALVEAGLYGEAADVLRAFQKVAPYNFEEIAILPTLAVFSGDRPLLEACLADLVIDAVRGVNYMESRSIGVRTGTFEGGPAVIIEPDWSGAERLTLPFSGLPGVILGRTPESLLEGRVLTANGLQRFLAVELHAVARVF